MASELNLMLAKLPPEEQERIRAKADSLEVLFKGDIVYMKDKDEGWDGMFDDEQLINETIEEMKNENY